MRLPCLWLAALLITLAATCSLPAAEPTGVAVGWGSHDGTILLQELNCVACHAGETNLLPKQAPRLSQAGSRLTPQYLRKFLAAPHLVKPGTPMPHLLHGLNENERRDTVESLTHFLASLGGPIDQLSSGSSQVQIDRGRDLFHSVGCVACHRPIEPPPEHKTDPATAQLQELLAEEEAESDRKFMTQIPLGDLSSKTTVEELAKFLDDPLHVRPSGRMPWLNLKAGEARAIASYLLRDQYTEGKSAPGPGLDVAYYKGDWNKVPEFDKLQPTWQGEAKSVDLASIKLPDGEKPKSQFAVHFEGILVVPTDGEYRFWTKSDDGSTLYIDQQLVVDNDGIHAPTEKSGTIQLSAGKHSFSLGLVQGGGGYELTTQWQTPTGKRENIPTDALLHSAPAAMIPTDMVDFKVDALRAAQGRELFATLGCAACHEVRQSADTPAIASKLAAQPLAELAKSPTAGCLSADPTGKTPQFGLSASQREAIAAALPKLSDLTPNVAHSMSSFSCYACHERGEVGGPSFQQSEYFTYEILVDWGEEGRLPPPINEVGAKLTEAGFDDMLFAGKRYRPYMATRMPQYGKENIGHLPEQFRLADENKIPPHEPQFSPRMVDQGRQLMGKSKLACINCHAWGELRLQGAEGLDLLEVPRRLQPGWFHALLEDPQVLRPRTRMPTPFPEGKSFFPDIQNGDVHKQIDTLWAYLSVGRKGGPPPGLTPDDSTLLTPVDEPITFRTFLDGYSAHAITVGFRQRTHMAFDANRVKSVVAWTGDFISAKPSWEGRAGQYAKITSADQVQFPDGPAFARLPSITQSWPKDLPKQKLGSSRRPEGWLFRGYRFNQERVPTFLYSIDGIQIEETPGTGFRQNESLLTRSFQIDSKQQVDDLYLILARGEKIQQQAGAFTVDDRLHYRVEGTPAAEPYIRESEGRQELLLPIGFSKTNNSNYQAEFEVELTW